MSSRPTSIPLQGSLLVASPLLNDGIFDHSVIFLTEHDEERGATGFIINNPLNQNFGQVVSRQDFPREVATIPVFTGGPVETQNILFTAFWRTEETLHYKSHISMEEAATLSKKPGTIVNAYAGHAGWTPGQLEHELSRATWTRVGPSPKLLDQEFDESLWKHIMRSLSPYHAIMAEASKHPFWN